MSEMRFGRLQRVTNIRQFWPREDTDFTPWLASKENITILSDTLGIVLEVQSQEVSVGRFRADILCRDMENESNVLIENQLERADHSHLGQIITYGAGLDTLTLIWIAECFDDEHRAAIDWLNKITDEKFRFFGLEIELWTIGDSPAAPKFNLVCKPNDWVREIRDRTEAASLQTPWREQQVDYWGEFGKYIMSVGSPFRPPTPKPTHYRGYGGIGRSYISLSSSFTKKCAEVFVQIDKKKRPTLFNELQTNEKEIEGEYGEELIWEEMPGKETSRIRISRDFDMIDRNNWPAVFEWMLNHMVKMKSIFSARIRTLSDSAPDERNVIDELDSTEDLIHFDPNTIDTQD